MEFGGGGKKLRVYMHEQDFHACNLFYMVKDAGMLHPHCVLHRVLHTVDI